MEGEDSSPALVKFLRRIKPVARNVNRKAVQVAEAPPQAPRDAPATKKKKGPVWIRYMDEEYELPYYYNAETEETLWVKPDDGTVVDEENVDVEQRPNADDLTWFEFYNTRYKCHYYHCPETAETSWNEPDRGNIVRSQRHNKANEDAIEWDTVYFVPVVDVPVALQEVDTEWFTRWNNSDAEPLLSDIAPHIMAFMADEQHPLGRSNLDFSDAFNSWIRQKSVDRLTVEPFLRNAISKICTFRDSMMHALTLCFPALEYFNELGDICRQCIRDAVVALVYDELFALYKIQYEAEDTSLSEKIELLRHLTTQDLGLSAQFAAALEESTEAPEAVLYISTFKTPSDKSLALVKACQAICNTITTYCICDGEQAALVAGDDLLAMFCFIIVKAKVPFLFSESRFIDDFMDDAQCTGEDAYALATLQSGINYTLSLDHASLQYTASPLLQSLLRSRELGEECDDS